MKKVMAATAGFLLAFAPAGTALAGETGAGNAWGNCKNSSAGGVHAPLSPEHGHGKGNGGLQALARATGAGDCVRPSSQPPADGLTEEERQALEDLLNGLPGGPDEGPSKQY